MALPPLFSPCLPGVNICDRTSHMYSTCSCMASNQIVELAKDWELKQTVCIVTWDLVGSSTSSHLEICSSCCSLMGKMCSEVWESSGHNQLYITSVHGPHSGSNGCSLSFQKVVSLISISVSDSVLSFFLFCFRDPLLIYLLNVFVFWSFMLLWRCSYHLHRDAIVCVDWYSI